jgi:hypothetical protein
MIRVALHGIDIRASKRSLNAQASSFYFFFLRNKSIHFLYIFLATTYFFSRVFLIFFGWIDAPPVGMADRHFEWEDKIRQLLVLLLFFHLTCHVTSSQWRHSPPLNFIRFPSNILRAGPTFVLFPCRVVWSCVFIFLITREMVFFFFFLLLFMLLLCESSIDYMFHPGENEN